MGTAVAVVTALMNPQDEDAYFRLLRLLTIEPRLTQRELSRAMGLSLGRTNYLLRALIAKGAIKVQNFSQSPRKLAYAYILTPKGLMEKTALTYRFLSRKRKEYEALKKEIDSVASELEPPSNFSKNPL